MRYSADWMVLLDERILELLNESEEFQNPKKMTEDEAIRYSPQHVGRRCKKLADAGLIQNVGQAVYRITDEGRAYLRGEYDVEKGAYIEKPDSNESGAAEDSQAENGV